MTFAEGFNKMCKSRGTTPTTVLKEMQLSTSKVTAWNNGSLPKEDVMIALAQHLGCSVIDFFMDDDVDKPLNDDESEILTIFRKLDRKTRHEFMAVAYDFEKKIDEDNRS